MGWLINSLIAIAVVSISTFIILIILVAITYETFNDFPRSIKVDSDQELDYTVAIFSFKKWRQMFEVNPTRFRFVTCAGECRSQNALYVNFRELHPIFVDPETNEIFLIDFMYWSYFRYYFYKNKIRDKLSYLQEEKITESIIRDVQKKIDVIIEDSQQKVRQSLEMQKKIVLQLNSPEKEHREGD